jgi:hypothetical protein
MPSESEIAAAKENPPSTHDLRAALYDIREAQRLAWGVRVLHSADQHDSTVSDALVSNELISVDSQESPAGLQMPGGVGLLYQAARFLQLRGGIVHVLGMESPGMDLEWITPTGGRAAIERKDRAFFQAITRKDEVSIERFFKDRLIKAAENLPMKPGVARIISVGYSADVKQAATLQHKFRALFSSVGRGMRRDILPDGAYGAFIGYDLVGSHEIAVDKGIFLEVSHEGYRLRPEFSRVRDDFKKVYGSRAPKQKRYR